MSKSLIQELEISDIISYFVYLAQLTESNTSENEMKTITEMLQKYLKNPSSLEIDLELFENVLRQNHLCGRIKLKLGQIKCVFCVKDKWFFQVIFLSSLMHIKKSFGSESTIIIKEILLYIFKYTRITNTKSIYLLRSLENILKLHPTLITSDILYYLERVLISPIENFKFYCDKILKLVVTHLSKSNINEFLAIENIPRNSLEGKHFNIESFSDNEIVNKILKLFENNIHNRDGGFLYQKVIEKYNFKEWQTNIWPTFLKNINLEMEGEIFQSYLKYWIPINVTKYKSEFAQFICNQSIDLNFMGHVLLEVRKSGYNNRNLLEKYLQKTFEYDASLGLRILCTYNKKSIYPDTIEMDFVKRFIFFCCEEQLDSIELKALHQYFSQMFLVSHNICTEKELIIESYTLFIWDLFNWCNFNLKNESNTELAAQVLNIINKVAIGDIKNLSLQYKLEQKDWYDVRENKLYLMLKNKNMWPFENNLYLENIVTAFKNNMGHSQNFTKLIETNKILIDKFEITNCIKLKQLVKSMKNSPSLQNTDKVKNYTHLLFGVISTNEKNKFLNEILQTVEQNLNSNNIDVNNIFEDVLLLQILLVDKHYNPEKVALIIQKSMDRIELILDKNKFFDYTSNVVTLKVFEAYINNIMIYIIKNEDVLKHLEKYKILSQLCKIIRISNMKRPVSLSIEVLKHLGAAMEENEYEKEQKILYVSEILQFISCTCTSNVTIRRCPESRLVLHAMCVSEKNEKKIILPWVLNFLLDTISDENTEPSVVSSSLHTLEILMSDCSLYKSSLSQLSNIIEICVNSFKNVDWLVRNADLQLAKSIIERTHGVSIGRFNRPRDICDLFEVCPNLQVLFCDIMNSYELDDSVIMVLQFFLESQVKNVSLSNFLEIFDHIIEIYPTSYGRFAVMAYIALIKEKDIPLYFTRVKNKMLFTQQLEKSVLWNYIQILKELYRKYMKTYDYLVNKNSIMSLDKDFEGLIPYFKSLNPVFLSLACLNVYENEYIIQILDNIFNDSERRIFEFNNVPYIFYNCKVEKIVGFLRRIYCVHISNCTEIKILEILIDRHKNKHLPMNQLKEILIELFHRILKIWDGRYIFYCYFQIISLFYEIVQPFDLTNILPFMRSNYVRIMNTKNLYQIMIVILVLANNVHAKSSLDKQFINFAMSRFKNVNTDIEEISESLSFCLKYLYKCVSCNKCKHDIFIIAFILIMKHKLYDFVDYLTNSRSISALEAVFKFLNCNILIKHLPDANILKHLLHTFYAIYLKEFCCSTKGSESFYVRNENCFISRSLFEKLLVNVLKNLSM